jgi:serine protease inhibitor
MDNLEVKKKKSKKKIIIISIIILIIIIIGILLLIFKNNNKTTKVSNKTKEVYNVYKMSGNSLEDFDLSFLQLENEEKNKVYSPLSIKYALEMLEEATSGESKTQLDSILGSYEAKKYTNSSNMSFANAMFINNLYKDNVKDSYTKNLVDKYYAEVIYDSFENANNVNSWVSNKTFGLVNNLVDDVSNVNFLLVNALAIDMEWNKKIQATWDNYKEQYSVSYIHENYSDYVPIIDEKYQTIQFNDNSEVQALQIGATVNKYDIVNELGEDNIRKTITEEYNKWLAEGGCGSDDLDTSSYVDKYISDINSNYKNITTSTDFLFYVDDDVKMFAKDLKTYDNTTLQYVGIMPTTDSLKDFIANNNSKSINKLLGNLKTFELDNFDDKTITKITGNIPLFNFDYELDLTKDLKTLGVSDVFDSNKADLSNLEKESGSVIDKVIHKANIEFSNEGIKAAAATSVGGLGAASCGFTYNYDVPVKTIDLTFNKPYMFIIRDKNTGEVWFTGTVYNPTLGN